MIIIDIIIATIYIIIFPFFIEYKNFCESILNFLYYNIKEIINYNELRILYNDIKNKKNIKVCIYNYFNNINFAQYVFSLAISTIIVITILEQYILICIINE